MKVNGIQQNAASSVDPDTPVLWLLRDVLGLTGTKFGCGAGLCGACTVQVDGKVVRSCITPVDAVKYSDVRTIEGLASTKVGKALQKAWLDVEVAQCGYCQSGQLMAASALLAKGRNPTDQEIDEAMSGNICRCGTYPRIKQAIKLAAAELHHQPRRRV